MRKEGDMSKNKKKMNLKQAKVRSLAYTAKMSGAGVHRSAKDYKRKKRWTEKDYE